MRPWSEKGLKTSFSYSIFLFSLSHSPTLLRSVVDELLCVSQVIVRVCVGEVVCLLE